MAFGGYKFKGYKVVRANLADNTYANWCLLVHQARIKAFMESCALSGAQWHFSKTNGPLAFEDYGNVIYRVANANGDYHDYLSFFKYGDEELYYMISTLGEYYFSSDYGTPALLSASRYCGTGSPQAASYFKFKFASFSSALSREEFNDAGPFAAWPSSALACTSQRCDYEETSSAWGSVNESSLHGASLADPVIYTGCVTKGKDIVWFKERTWNSCCIESGDAFSSFCDPDDTYGHLKLVLGFNQSEHTQSQPSSAHVLHYFNAECLTSSGSRAFMASAIYGQQSYSNATIIPDYGAFIGAGGQKVPFGSVYLSNLGKNIYDYSANKINQKGLIKNELLCANAYVYSAFNDAPAIGSPVLGGNLICAAESLYTGSLSFSVHGFSGGYKTPCVGEANTSPTNNIGICCYVGWDPSNPDITNEASWPELALQ